jgi:hypothetical protein
VEDARGAREGRAKLATAAHKIEYWQKRRERSANFLRRRRLRELHQTGIRPSRLRKCAAGDMALWRGLEARAATLDAEATGA